MPLPQYTPDSIAPAVCEQEIATIAPAVQHEHGPEHELDCKPVLLPKKPAGHGIGLDAPPRQYLQVIEAITTHASMPSGDLVS